MRRKRSNLRKERIIMLSASAFVLTALTMTGVYVREKNKIDNEYHIDLNELDNNGISQKADEIADEFTSNGTNISSLSDDMDVDPNSWEVNSTGVDTPQFAKSDDDDEDDSLEDKSEIGQQEEEDQSDNDKEDVETAQNNVEAVIPERHFNEESKLMWPMNGEIIIPYSMDKTVYFETLNQYKYSPAIVIAAAEGENIIAGAKGLVKTIGSSSELGKFIVFDIGDGYEMMYGQLTDITVKEGELVDAGEVIGKVAAPSVYYSSEGSNVYFKLTKDGTAVNPLNVLE